MNKPISVTLIDKETGKSDTLPVLQDTVYVGWENKGVPPIDIATSFNFNCRLDTDWSDIDPEVERLYKQTSKWEYAVKLSETLNDLIEEYHAPGNSRHERREIKRQFGKVFMVFLKHCRMSQISYTFKRVPK